MANWRDVLKRAVFIGLFLVAAGVHAPLKAENLATSPFGEPFEPIDAAVQNQRMGRGINVLGYDPLWKAPEKARFKPEFFAKIRDAGFSQVRFVLEAFAFIDADGKIESQWLETLDTMVRAALGQGLTVILDEHDFQICAKDAALCRNKLNAFWTEISQRYKNASNRVVFEILNEPNGALTAEVWNDQLLETLKIIRATNPTRNVVIGPTFWNGLDKLPSLKLPAEDRHIIVTFHYYYPMEFTHQGIPWMKYYSKMHTRWGSAQDYKILDWKFDFVKAWSLSNNRPILLGEFGAYEAGDMTDRARWTAAVARAAEKRGFSWAYWQFDASFVLWDFAKGEWVKPILDALISP